MRAAARAPTRQAIQYIFQSPYSSLNPRKTIGQILSQPLKVFFDLDRATRRRRRMAKALDQVALDASLLSAGTRTSSPAGERQRVAIARGLAAEPTVLICDEVTSWLDVSVQAAIIELLAGLQRDMGLSMLFVTHNLALVRSISQEVAVMNEGRIVEYGAVSTRCSTIRRPTTPRSCSRTRPPSDRAPSRLHLCRRPVGARRVRRGGPVARRPSS